MSAFRDEHAALLARVEALEEELSSPDRTRRLLIMTAALVAICGVAFLLVRSAPVTPSTPRIEERDPSKLLALARAKATAAGMTERGEIQQLVVWYVASDGLLYAGPSTSITPRFEVTFSDQGEPPPAPSNAPVGAPSPIVLAHDYRIAVSGGDLRMEQSIMPAIGTTLPAPRCTAAALWKAAIAAGASKDAVATLRYESSLARTGSTFVRSPSWRFSIAGTEIDLRMSDATCAIEK